CLLLKDEALHDRPARPAILPRPKRRDPSLPVEDPMPEQHLLLGQVGLGIGNTHLRRIVLRNEASDFLPKRLVLLGEHQLHRSSSGLTAVTDRTHFWSAL